MARQNTSPYICHVFICTHDRHGQSKSCADAGSVDIRETIKQAVTDRGWKGRVRVSQSGCLGLCADGPNVMLYPQRIWFSAVTPEDVPEILSQIEATFPAGA